jgi:hypothetical protein
MRRTLAFALALAVTAGCSSTTQGSGAGPRSSSNVLTQTEIAASRHVTAYEAVERLRPNFLRSRATSARQNAYPDVFVDGIRRGSPETLKAIPAAEVSEIRYLTVQDATTRYGLNVPAGVIDVKLIGR